MNLIKKGLVNKSKGLALSLSKGFTLVEILVVVAVLSVVGILVLTIFTRTLKGTNKTQILGAIKQNGQSVLETMTNTVRNSDRVVCTINLTSPGPTLVIVKNGVYTRYRFIAPTGTVNGYFQQETFNLPSSPPSGSDPKLYIRDFEDTVCINPSENPQVITDTHPQSGVSLASGSFSLNRQAGFKDNVKVTFELSPGVRTLPALVSEIGSVTFETTIVLR